MERKARVLLSMSAAALAGAAVVMMVYSGAWSAPVSAHGPPGVGEGSAEHAAERLRQDEHPAVSDARLRDPVRLDLSAPFAGRYEQIAERADRGDLDAICTIVHALEHCRSRERMRADAQAIEGMIASQPPDGEHAAALMRDLLAKEAEIAGADRFCEHLDAADGPELAQRTYQAAQHGDVGAMVRFALRPPLGGEIDVEGAEIAVLYRKEAMRLLERAALLGSRDAARALLIAQVRGNLVGDYGELPVRSDPDLLFAAAAVVRRFDGPQLDVESELAQALSAANTSAPSPRAADLKAAMEAAVATRMQVDANPLDAPVDGSVDFERVTCR